MLLLHVVRKPECSCFTVRRPECSCSTMSEDLNAPAPQCQKIWMLLLHNVRRPECSCSTVSEDLNAPAPPYYVDSFFAEFIQSSSCYLNYPRGFYYNLTLSEFLLSHGSPYYKLRDSTGIYIRIDINATRLLIHEYYINRTISGEL